MPTYCYTCEACGQRQEAVSAMDSRPASVPCQRCSGTAHRDMGAEGPATPPSAWRNFHSHALAVHPRQVKRMRERFPHHNYDDAGHPRPASRAQRRRMLKDLGYRDLDGGYSD